MTKAWIMSDDPFIYTPNNLDEVIEQFGEDFVGWSTSYVEIPEELYLEFKEASKKFWEVQEKLRPFYDKQYEEK